MIGPTQTKRLINFAQTKRLSGFALTRRMIGFAQARRRLRARPSTRPKPAARLELLMSDVLRARAKRAARVVCACVALVAAAGAAHATVKVTVERNTGGEATPAFKFRNVPSPAKDDAGAKAALAVVVGRRDANGAQLAALTDGLLPASDDEPRSNFFFNAGSDGGRFRLDFGSVVEIAQVNTFSWHADSRAPQVYNLFASDGAAANFNAAPDERTDPRDCGWRLVATVDTRPARGETGGQYGVSVTDTSGSLGKFRYLLFDAVPTEYEDGWGNTFFSEVDVFAKK